jgi:hypothetical protein
MYICIKKTTQRPIREVQSLCKFWLSSKSWESIASVPPGCGQIRNGRHTCRTWRTARKTANNAANLMFSILMYLHLDNCCFLFVHIVRPRSHLSFSGKVGCSLASQGPNSYKDACTQVLVLVHHDREASSALERYDIGLQSNCILAHPKECLTAERQFLIN